MGQLHKCANFLKIEIKGHLFTKSAGSDISKSNILSLQTPYLAITTTLLKVDQITKGNTKDLGVQLLS